jgi:hypothetical protein
VALHPSLDRHRDQASGLTDFLYQHMRDYCIGVPVCTEN